MENKKNPNIDLKNKRNHFFLIGLVFSTSLTLLAFEWRSVKEEKALFTTDVEEALYEDEMPQTFREQKRELPKPIQPKHVSPEISTTPDVKFTIVDNQTEIKDGYQAADMSSWDSWFDTEPEPDVDPIVDFAEFAPEFPGGDKALLEFIGRNVKYSTRAKDAGIEGYVGVSFVVEKDGSISNIELIRSLHNDLDKVVIKTVEKMPKWKPGVTHGKYVRTRFNLPVNFKLN